MSLKDGTRFAGAGDNGGERTGNDTVETGSNGRVTIELASYLTARWRRSSANWFPMLPPLPRDKTGFASLLLLLLLLFRSISRYFLCLFSSRSLISRDVRPFLLTDIWSRRTQLSNRHIRYCINV